MFFLSFKDIAEKDWCFYVINIALPIVFAIATIVGVGLTARHVRNVAKSAVYAHEESEIRLLCKIINFRVFLGLITCFIAKKLETWDRMKKRK